MSLIEQLYTEKEVNQIRLLYSTDPSCREQLYSEFARKIIEKSETFLTSKPLDILSLICMTANFADNKEECQTVAIIVHKRLNEKNPLPYIMDDKGFNLAEKTLVSLSFFRKAMEYRCKYKGAPSTNFYRSASKILFSKNGHQSIADHHEQWESFLSEIFI